MPSRIPFTTLFFAASLVCIAPATHGALPDPLAPAALPQGLGVNIHFTDPRPGEMKMLAATGVTWVRMDLHWAGTERKKGEYDFAAYERLFKALDEYTIRPLFILDYGHPLYDGERGVYTDAGRAAMAKWAAAAVTHFKGRGAIWEMWNEPNHKGFWKPKPDAALYAKLSNEVGKAIRAAAPDELFIGPATSTIDLPFLEACFQGGCLEYSRAVSVHPYRQSEPETVIPEYERLRFISQYAPKGKTIPILSGEWGYSAAWQNYDAERQGTFLPRQWLTNVSQGVPISIWYDWHDDGGNPKEAEHNFGLVRHPYVKDRDPVYDPKPAYATALTLTTTLRGYTFNKRLDVGDEDAYVLLFQRGAELKLAVWCVRGQRAVRIPASPGTFTAVGDDGTPLDQITADRDGLGVTVSERVGYLTPTEANDLLRLAAGWDRLPLSMRGRDGKVTVEMAFTNPLDRAVRVRTYPPDAPVEVRPGQTVRLTKSRNAKRSLEPDSVPFVAMFEGIGKVYQTVRFQTTNPRGLTVLPPGPESVGVRVDNPSGEAFTGILSLTTGRVPQRIAAKREPPPDVDVASLDVSLAAGETSKVFEFPLAPPPNDRPLTASLYEDTETRMVMTPTWVYRPIDSFDGAAGAKPAGHALHVDGDAKLKSEAALVHAAPPAGGPAAEVGALKLTYRFEAGWQFARVAPKASKPIDGEPAELILWVHGDGKGLAPRMRFADASGEIFQPTAEDVTWTGWRLLRFPLDGSNAGHWGGDNDGKVKYPIRIDTLFLLDNTSREATSGEVMIAGPTVVTP